MGIASAIARNTTFSFIESLSGLGTAFVLGIVLARSLGTEQYGLYSYLIWFSALACTITNLGLGEMSRRFMPEAAGRQNMRERMGYAQLTLMLRAIATLVVSSIIIISSGYWARLNGNPDNQLLFILIGLSAFLDSIQQAFIQILKGFQRFDYSLYDSLSMYPLRMVLVIIFMALGFGVLEILLLNIATLFLGILVGFFLLSRLAPLRSLFSTLLLSSDAKKRAMRYSFTIAGVLILTYLVYNQAELFFVGLFCPLEQVGFYNIAFKLAGMAVTTIPAAFGVALLPAIAEQFGMGENEKIKRIYLTSARCMMMISLPIAAGTIALADSIIILLYGADYMPAVILFQILALSYAIYSFNYTADTVIRGINRPGFLLKTMVLLAVIKIGLSLWLIPEYGAFGAVIAASVPQIIALPVYITFVFKKTRAIWPLQDTLKIALASLIMGTAVYFLHSQLGTIPGLVLCVPLGVVIYIISIFVLRVIQEQDIVILENIQNSLPVVLRKHYIRLVAFLGRRRTAPL